MIKLVDESFDRELPVTKSESEAALPTLAQCPGPPEWMGYQAQLEWLRSAPKLFEQGRLSGGVESLFENYCVAIGIVREMNAFIEADGKFIGGKVHPALKEMMGAMREAKSLAQEIKFEKEKELSAEEKAAAAAAAAKDAEVGAGWDKELLG